MLSGDTIRTIGSAVTILVALVGAIWYLVSLDIRVRQLENQLHALALSPVIEKPATGPSASPKIDSGGPAPQSSMVVPNPLQQTCADLATRAAKAIENNSPLTVGEPIQALMKSIGCDALRPR
jgi:hypothetical protein